MTISLGVAMPLLDTGGSPEFVRDFAQAAEDLGYQGLALADHVLGANVRGRPNWGDRNTSADYFHDPFVLFECALPWGVHTAVTKRDATLWRRCAGGARLGFPSRKSAA